MSPDEYLDQRLEDQIKWYDNKSRKAQGNYKFIRVGEIVCAASIPLLSGLSVAREVTVPLTGFLGAAVAVMTALLGLYQFQEHWIEYRTTCEALRHEKFLFLTRTAPYNVPDPFALLVQRVESFISKENVTWSQSALGTKGGDTEARAPGAAHSDSDT